MTCKNKYQNKIIYGVNTIKLRISTSYKNRSM